jgi:hypothetical protein
VTVKADAHAKVITREVGVYLEPGIGHRFPGCVAHNPSHETYYGGLLAASPELGRNEQ